MDWVLDLEDLAEEMIGIEVMDGEGDLDWAEDTVSAHEDNKA